MSKRVLITGAFGQLGDAVILELEPHFELCATGCVLPDDGFQFCQNTVMDVTVKNQVIECIEDFPPMWWFILPQ